MKTPVDSIIYNANIYAVDSTFSTAQSIAIKDGQIVDIGSNDEIQSKFEGELIDAKGNYVFPGFYDPHCHIINYGKMFSQVNLVGTKSFDEVISQVVRFSEENTNGWIVGRGWDQNDWQNKSWPHKAQLDKAFPNRPVYLIRIDGHAALANQAALNAGGITADMNIEGGEALQTDAKLTGVLIDAAMDSVRNAIPKNPEARKQYILKTQEDALSLGLTSLGDAWIEFDDFLLYQQLEESGELLIDVYMMLAPYEDNKKWFGENGPYQSKHINARAYKYFNDGALGSRGAALVEDYADDPGNSGLFMESAAHFEAEAKRCFEQGFQMNTHCIGDAGNQMMLDIYAKILKSKNNRRWRIEHAQVLQKDDFSKFGDYSILPSIQTTHATSDMYWAEERLGPERIKYAYAYKDLLRENGLIINGSDFPIEHINPLYGFYAAVARQDHDGFPEGGFQAEQALSRQEALKAMTIWSAYGQFEEDRKGSLEPGKQADFVILDKDIMTCPISEVLNAKVLSTYVRGQIKFKLNFHSKHP